MFVDLLATGTEVSVTTTAMNEGSAWGTHGVILGANEGGLLLEEDMTSPYATRRDLAMKRTRKVFFPWANVAAVCERHITETPVAKICPTCGGSGYGENGICETCDERGTVPLDEVK